MTGFRVGDVVKYTPAERFDRWWCREGRAVAFLRGGSVALADTYWGNGFDNHILTDGESATAELLFNVEDYDELPHRSGDQWRKYPPADRGVIPSQHGLQRRYFIRKGATEDLPTQIENAREALAEAEREADSARRRVEYRTQELSELEATAVRS